MADGKFVPFDRCAGRLLHDAARPSVIPYSCLHRMRWSLLCSERGMIQHIGHAGVQACRHYTVPGRGGLSWMSRNKSMMMN